MDGGYDELSSRLDQLFKSCGDVKVRFLEADNARELRAPKDREEIGHPFLRPVVQKVVCRILRQVVEQDRLSWGDCLDRLSKLTWELGAAPWLSVYLPEQGKMLSGKDNRDLLELLLINHVAPPSKQSIRRARKSYRELIGSQYPIPEDDMFENIVEEAVVDS